MVMRFLIVDDHFGFSDFFISMVPLLNPYDDPYLFFAVISPVHKDFGYRKFNKQPFF